MSTRTERRPTPRLSKARAAEKTIAAKGAAAPPPLPQAELRTRRRAGLPVVYNGEFDLAAEISDICMPLARRAARCNGLHMAFPSLVRDLVDAVHGELVSTVVGWLAEIDAAERIAREVGHLDSASQKQAVRHLVDLAPRPAVPQVDADEIRTRTWATDLVEMAQHYSTPLADLLARSRRPGDPDLRGAVSRSERLCDLLREVDTAARQLEIRIEKAEHAAARRPRPAQTRTQATRASLRKLGIEA
ncbi:hypothetical protein [Mycolicibacterium hippocampi]|uniref:Uncharacterized protein n=1 Tax=Mycolicibacterium hippocampi TaxID=659824 RepID=A0A850PM66_9MYCO|nr:hypothetical protein [Mycolicibacterium hippocampi]NVN51698.1 hypothetical protein [Mycolicibacterium hippocampi]